MFYYLLSCSSLASYLSAQRKKQSPHTWINSLNGYFFITECTDGKFGDNCTKTCHCENNDVCDKIHGICLNGCSPGYDEEEDSSCQTSEL